MATLRTREAEQHYQDYIAAGHLEQGCPLCAATPVETFALWKIIENDFPYDRIAQVHRMIVPLRHVGASELSTEELAELEVIKAGYINTNYEFMVEATNRRKSIPSHFHLHLLVVKEEA